MVELVDRHAQYGRGGQRLRGRLRFLREGEGGEDGILLGARDHDGVCDLEGLSAQFAQLRKLSGKTCCKDELDAVKASREHLDEFIREKSAEYLHSR